MLQGAGIMLSLLTNLWNPQSSPKAMLGRSRSAKWPKVRREHLKKEPKCVCCGRPKRLDVHHLQPYHLFPDRELDPKNLITLCGDGWPGCHLMLGHSGDWSEYVHPVDVLSLIEVYRELIKEVVESRAKQ